HICEHLEQVRPKAADGVILTRASDLKITPIIWLWRDWLACGKLHLLAGAPGQGKTTIALSLAATVTSGGRWPDGSRCPVGSVLVWSGEDDPADTLAPRLKAMGADMGRVFFVSGARVDGEEQPFDPARDLIQLAAAVGRIGDVRLIVVDPIVSAVAGDSHKNTEVRRALQPLVDMAAAAGAAVVGITHLSKGTAGRDPTERVTGSIAFTAVVRVVLMAAKVRGEDGEDRRILARSKSNIGPDDGGFVYSLEQTEAIPGVQASAVRWGEAVEGTARELLAESEADRDDAEGSAKDRAEAWLIELLAGGAIQAKQVQADAKEAGLAWATVRRAADSLNVARIKDGLRGGWYWRINDRLRDQFSEGAHQDAHQDAHEGAHEGAHPER
ncbi:MAG: putative primase/helicase, partial [Pseudomonadota bacterium]|nr:putative primase/helicase [Pseudomonadota bacterium]